MLDNYATVFGDEAEGQQGEVERNSATLRSAIERLDRARDTKDLVEDPV